MKFSTEFIKQPKLIIFEPCLSGIKECIQPEIDLKIEGICYLLGKTNGSTTYATYSVRPKATCTRGSFHVDTVAMAKIVRVATNKRLQVVGQLHTHPYEAYHSDGDEEGARIAYDGYVSIVLPNYGNIFPRFDGAVVYIFSSGKFRPFTKKQIKLVPDLLI